MTAHPGLRGVYPVLHPLAPFFARPAWLVNLFLIEDWSWFAMMVPITLWYWRKLKMDRQKPCRAILASNEN